MERKEEYKIEDGGMYGVGRCTDFGNVEYREPGLESVRVSFFFSTCRARSRLGRSSKRLVVGQLFSGCKRTGEMQKPDVFQCRNKTTPKHKHKPNTARRKTSSKLSETLRFQKDEILGALSTSSRRHSNSRK